MGSQSTVRWPLTLSLAAYLVLGCLCSTPFELRDNVYIQHFITNRYEPKTHKLRAVIIGKQAWFRGAFIDAEEVEISLYTDDYGTIKVYLPECRLRNYDNIMTSKGPVRIIGHEINITSGEFRLDIDTGAFWGKDVKMGGLKAQEFFDKLFSSPSSILGIDPKKSKK